ncbi:MAG: PQQ-like beta-propeller repeat protein [Candidatus Sumerlaeota bacterium]|nr:PQQ-like beta-propeller repeat protein [Candidatus Sumerlaeota bacterium]
MLYRCFPLLALLTALSAPGRAADEAPYWPQFHGPHRDNCSSETALLKQWPPEGPKLLWTAKGIGYGYACVSIAKGRIYTAGEVEGKTLITAMDMNGRILWQVPNGIAWTGQHPGARGTPTLDGDRLYHENAVGDIVCLNAATGEKVWGLNILKEFGSGNLRWGQAESLLIDGERVIACPGGPKACMVALDKRTGRTVWQARGVGDLAGYASPALTECGGLRLIVTLTSKAMIGVNADTGELLWRQGHTTYADENTMEPLCRDGYVCVSTLGVGAVKWRIRVQGAKASVEEVWRTSDIDNHHGGVVLVDGFLYGASTVHNKAGWVCLDWATGAMRWVGQGVGKGSLTYADGMLYTLSEKHVMGLTRATPTGLEVVSRFNLPEPSEWLSWTHPVVCGGRLYLRDSDRLFAYDVHGGL